MKFRYKRYDADVLRPVIPVILTLNGQHIPYEALVDSGADICIFDAQLADIVGLDVTTGVQRKVAGITGQAEVQYLHRITINVGGWERVIDAGFLPNIGKYGYGILGQRGFFEFFKVAFDFAKETIEVKPRS